MSLRHPESKSDPDIPTREEILELLNSDEIRVHLGIAKLVAECNQRKPKVADLLAKTWAETSLLVSELRARMGISDEDLTKVLFDPENLKSFPSKDEANGSTK